MHTHPRQVGLAIGLLLACLTPQALADSPRPSSPPGSLWELLRIPGINRDTNTPNIKRQPASNAAANPKTKSPRVAARNNSVEINQPKTSESDSFTDDFNGPTSDAAAAISATGSKSRSSRRTAILKRESARLDSATGKEADSIQPASRPPVTPHWTPAKIEQSVFLQPLADGSERPIAVTIVGEPLSDHSSVSVAVAKMDGSIGISPAAIALRP